MNFSENLVTLRKKSNMTQEQLAERLNVTRQTIYKYETGQTYPEMDKLLDLSKIFNINLDQLINGQIDEDLNNPIKSDVIKHYKGFFSMIGLGVFLILIGVAQIMLWEDFAPANSKLSEFMPVTILFIFVIFALIIFIFFGMSESAYREENVFELSFTKSEKNKANRTAAITISLGISLILIGLILLIIFDEVLDSKYDWPVAILISLVGVATFLFIRFGGMLSLYKDKDFFTKDADKKKSSTLTARLSGVIWILSLIVFLVWGFLFHGGFALSWISFLVGGLLCVILSIALNDK